MKLLLTLFALSFAVAVVAGCRLHSIVDLQNPEFPQKLSPADVSGELFDKYSIAGVIVEPQIRHGFEQEQYKLAVVFASKSNTVEPSIEDITVSVKGVPLAFDSLIGRQRTTWVVYPDEPFFVCSISGPDNIPFQAEMTNVRVDVSLTAAVTHKSGEVMRKQIKCYFVPKRRA